MRAQSGSGTIAAKSSAPASLAFCSLKELAFQSCALRSVRATVATASTGDSPTKRFSGLQRRKCTTSQVWSE